MKKIPLRIRFTIMASLFLMTSCLALAAASNYSAGKIVDASMMLPSQSAESAADPDDFSHSLELPSEEPALAAKMETEAHYRIFQKETAFATCVIVVIGSIAAYFASGYVLKPIHSLAEEVKKRNVNTLDQPLPIPQSADEIQELTLSFNLLLSELRRSFALQRQFSADAAHELRTPIAVMRTKLDVLALSADTSQETKLLAASLDGQLERLSSLIEDLLLFSKDLPLDSVGSVSLLPLLQDVTDELSELASQKNTALFIEGDDCVVQGQDRLLERVFYNLIENAIKYSPYACAVYIRLNQEPDGVRVTVADEGEGIPEELRETIFEPFFRIDRSRSRAIGGNGLGLAVCKKMLDRHNASIRVFANTPRGSVFEIYFPA